jgi:rhodanese-related sulfurtransferase
MAARITEFEARATPAPRAPIVIYCSGGGCEDSHLLAKRLIELGYRNLLIYLDGFPDWTGKGRPVVPGTSP